MSIAIFVMLGGAAFAACGSEGATVEPAEGGAPEADGGTSDPDGAPGADGSSFDASLFDAGAPCGADPSCDRRVAFITQDAYDGALGGLSDADQICMTEAQANPLLAGRTFRAWLSTNGTSARSRFPAFTGALRRVDGEIIANGMAELLSTGPRVPINRPPSGATAISSLVWTGTDANGDAIADKNCMGWSSDAAILAGVGKSDDLPSWTSTTPDRPCAIPLRLYCIES